MKKQLKRILLLFFEIFMINSLFRFLNRNKAMILCYHGICDDNFNLLKGYDERHIPKSLFKKQLEYLKKKKYNFISMSELVDTIKNNKKINKLVTLTFDDGFQNVVANAYPIIRKFNARGCFYLVSSLIGSDKLLWTDYLETIVRNSKKEKFQFIFKGRQIYYKLDSKDSYEKTMRDIKKRLRTLSDRERVKHLQQFNDKIISDVPKEFLFSTWEQIRSLNQGILEVGAHTMNHPNCSRLTSDSEFERELKKSKIDIERMIDCEVKHFNYPAGCYNDEVIKNVKKYGYKSAVSLIHGFNDEDTDLYKLKRIEVNEDFLLFKATISSSYSCLLKIKEFIKGWG